MTTGCIPGGDPTASAIGRIACEKVYAKAGRWRAIVTAGPWIGHYAHGHTRELALKELHEFIKREEKSQ